MPDNKTPVFHRVRGQLTVGRELTAKHGKQRALPFSSWILVRAAPRVIACAVGLIIAQRTDAGVRPDDVVAPQLFLEVRAL